MGVGVALNHSRTSVPYVIYFCTNFKNYLSTFNGNQGLIVGKLLRSDCPMEKYRYHIEKYVNTEYAVLIEICILEFCEIGSGVCMCCLADQQSAKWTQTLNSICHRPRIVKHRLHRERIHIEVGPKHQMNLRS